MKCSCRQVPKGASAGTSDPATWTQEETWGLQEDGVPVAHDARPLPGRYVWPQPFRPR